MSDYPSEPGWWWRDDRGEPTPTLVRYADEPDERGLCPAGAVGGLVFFHIGASSWRYVADAKWLGPVQPPRANPAPQKPPTRPNHLAWNGTEWTDTRCGCRYHPDDDNGSHNGAPHVHRCERHEPPAVPLFSPAASDSEMPKNVPHWTFREHWRSPFWAWKRCGQEIANAAMKKAKP